jgi:hypothetical protein
MHEIPLTESAEAAPFVQTHVSWTAVAGGLCLLSFLFVVLIAFVVVRLARRRANPRTGKATSCPGLHQLRALAAGQVAEPALAAHVDSCSRCQEIVEAIQAERGSWPDVSEKLRKGLATRDLALQRAMAELKAESSQEPISDVLPVANGESLAS